MPFFVSAPILYYFFSKLRESALMQEELARAASQDSLTTCLNRGAFITLVEAYYDRPAHPMSARYQPIAARQD